MHRFDKVQFSCTLSQFTIGAVVSILNYLVGPINFGEWPRFIVMSTYHSIWLFIPKRFNTLSTLLFKTKSFLNHFIARHFYVKYRLTFEHQFVQQKR